MTKKVEQEKQDTEYDFPYHYLPRFKGEFKQLEVWGWAKNYASAIEFILENIKNDFEHGNVMLDVGCGDGRLTRELAMEFKESKIIGIDYSKKAIDLANAMNSNMNNIEFNHINLIEDSFKFQADIVTLVEVLEHIPTELCNKFVQRLSEIIKPNGIIYLTVPHSNVPVSYKHFQHFDLNKLQEYFEDDFYIEVVEYIQRSSFFLKLCNKIMNNNFFIINEKRLNKLFYKIYKKHYFFTSDQKCERVYLKMRRK